MALATHGVSASHLLIMQEAPGSIHRAANGCSSTARISQWHLRAKATAGVAQRGQVFRPTARIWKAPSVGHVV